MDTTLLLIQKFGDDDYSVWFPSIPENEPLLVSLIEKYADSGCSCRGDKQGIIEEIGDGI